MTHDMLRYLFFTQPVRPIVLSPLFASVLSLPGIGPRLGKLLEKVSGPTVGHTLWHLPTGLIDRRFTPKIAQAPHGQVCTIIVRVDGHAAPLSPRQPYRIRCTDETGLIEITYFHAKQDYLATLFPVGQKVAISGRVEQFHKNIQMAHPDYVVAEKDVASIAVVEPVYALTAGLSPKILRKAIAAALKKVPDLPEWLDPAWQQRQRWPAWKEALTTAHTPQSEQDILPTALAHQRLAYDEILANQLALALVRRRQKQLAGRTIQGDGRLRQTLRAALPYQLTNSQHQALEEIYADMAASTRMLRLLQGDVGSGKTIVAFMVMLNAVEAGCQAAIMAPTEILARQHFESMTPWAEACGVRLHLLTGREKGSQCEEIMGNLADGTTQIAVGTHALFQEDVQFKNLGLAVVDEQHRFGVQQRLQLAVKGAVNGEKAADLLVMTATPIPRTLALTAYGDLDISRLTEKPPGRLPIDTRLIPLDRLDELVTGLRRKIAEGARAYWVCPLVDESELIDLAAATERHAYLKGALGERVGLIHGQMKGPDKDAVMAAFQRGDLDVLVATTVIEVGVNVPEATVMVIEHAERFGLAQLHQLRGRVGRGRDSSTCILLYDPKLGETAKSRLKMMRETEDGFRIAEEDLRLRGAGEILGTRQSGLLEFRLANPSQVQDFLPVANDDARLILAKDPELSTPRGQALRTLLYLFEHDSSIKYLRSG